MSASFMLINLVKCDCNLISECQFFDTKWDRWIMMSSFVTACEVFLKNKSREFVSVNLYTVHVYSLVRWNKYVVASKRIFNIPLPKSFNFPPRTMNNNPNLSFHPQRKALSHPFTFFLYCHKSKGSFLLVSHGFLFP